MTAVPASPAASQQAAVDAALLVLKSMGLSLDDLAAPRTGRPCRPSPGTSRSWPPRLPRHLAGVPPLLEADRGAVGRPALGRAGAVGGQAVRGLRQGERGAAPHGRGGHNAEENLISALRCLYRRAVDDGLIDEKDNPARKVPKPRRPPSTRRALADARLAEINQVAAVTATTPN